MITWEVWTLILAFAVPMIASPGPGNTLLAAAGGQFGVKNSIPFWLGFEAANLLLCLIYGCGLSRIFQHLPYLHELLKWGGILYLLYLAYGFFASSSLLKVKKTRSLGMLDGLISISVNPKVHSMILVMFSQFLNPAAPLLPQVAQITIVFVAISILCHFLWLYAGQVIFSRIKGNMAMRMQGIGFGICMLLVALFTATA